MTNDTRELLSSALSLWWLRPENGLSIASYILNGYNLRPEPGKRSADYACGDGVNMFFKTGGRFTADFDLFSAGIRQDSGKDIVQKSIDVFDHYETSYAPPILRRPDEAYTFGTDHKKNLLMKAEKLSFYETLLEADLRDDTAIEDESLDFVYCNSIYWVHRPDLAAAYMYKKLRSGGIAVFDVMTSHRQDIQFQNLFPTLPSEWHHMMNRGREVNNPGIMSANDWRATFEAVGVATVEDVRDIFPSTIAHAWNVGLRPIFPLLQRMVNSLTPENRRDIKEEWVATWTDLLMPLLETPNAFVNDGRQVRLQYIVRKK